MEKLNERISSRRETENKQVDGNALSVDAKSFKFMSNSCIG